MELTMAIFGCSHGFHEELEIPDADVLICTGDFSFIHVESNLENTQKYVDWMANQPHKHKILCAGNHDWFMQDIYHNPELREQIDWKGVQLLMDEEAIIDGVKFYVSPWVPRFFDWAFMLDTYEELEEKWKAIPDDVEVLVTHGPAFGILDRNYQGSFCGDSALLERIKSLKKLKMHCFSHIHEAYGTRFNGHLAINASIGDRCWNLQAVTKARIKEGIPSIVWE